MVRPVIRAAQEGQETGNGTIRASSHFADLGIWIRSLLLGLAAVATSVAIWMSSEISTYALELALTASFLLAGLAFLGQVAHRRAQNLAEANRAQLRQIEEREAAEAEIHRLNRELEARVAERTENLNEAISELEAFNYSVSHDLRSPLGAILNYAALLEEDYRSRLDPSGREFLERISASARSALSMMDGLLAFSRMGREQMKLVPVDMTRLFRVVFDELAAGKTWIRAELDLGQLPVAHADAAMMRIVATNLLSNAIKFAADREQPRIEVGSQRAEEEDVYWVRDNGVGFDMRFASKLFAVFERLHSSEEFEGSGVGLAIVGRIVRRHGGRVSAEGELGEGATFSFSLPRAPEPREDRGPSDA